MNGLVRGFRTLGWGLSIELEAEQSHSTQNRKVLGGELLERGGIGAEANLTCFTALSGTKPSP